MLIFLKRAGSSALIFIFLSVGFARSQEALLFSRFDQTLYGINPALSGIDSGWKVQAGYRQPFTGFDNGPSTIFVGGTGAITRYRNLFRSQQTMRTSTSAQQVERLRQAGSNELKHGLGFFISRYESGPFITNRLSGNYSVHLPLTSKLRASAGIGLELVNPRLDPGEIRPRDAENDFVYFSLISVGSSRNFLNLDLGLSLYSDNFYFGYTLHSATEVALDTDNSTETQVNYMFHSVIGGADFDLPRSVWNIKPSFLLRYDELQNIQASAVVQAEWRDQVAGGLVYKLHRSAGLTAGFTFRGQYTLNYTYEVITNDNLSQLGNNSHEVMLSFLLSPPVAGGPR
ncbi:PorP/SprF family type IX secretion system membrane protein [Roseivirga sp. BDSF3-8]|uniref:PorP/SprF family type IX secretion system membrane protein n=1 Tax=Roseivirga sp. BDSF3-8 TaxID=3241598 RepID=UPI0035322587